MALFSPNGIDDEGILKNDNIITWTKELLEKERDNAGLICKTGEYELQGIARRLRNRLGLDKNPSGPIIVETTYKQRTKQSRDAFMNALLPETYPREDVTYEEAYKCEKMIGEDQSINQSIYEKYAHLRFFSICPVISFFLNLLME